MFQKHNIDIVSWHTSLTCKTRSLLNSWRPITKWGKVTCRGHIGWNKVKCYISLFLGVSRVTSMHMLCTSAQQSVSVGRSANSNCDWVSVLLAFSTTFVGPAANEYCGTRSHGRIFLCAKLPDNLLWYIISHLKTPCLLSSLVSKGASIKVLQWTYI